MEAVDIIERARAMGISLAAEGGHIAARPKGRTPHELAADIRAYKRELLAHLHAQQERAEIDRPGRGAAEQDGETVDQAIALLNRIRCYALQAGRMPVAREMAQRLEPLKDASPEIILHALQDFERELIGLGGCPDLELAKVLGAVEAVFRGARLVEVRRKEPPPQ